MLAILKYFIDDLYEKYKVYANIKKDFKFKLQMWDEIMRM